MGNKYALIASGYISIDHLIKLKDPATPGFTSLISNKNHSTIHYGGCSSNICYTLNKLGTKAIPIMRVGSDWKSNGFRKYLQKGGISLQATTEVPDETCSCSYILEDKKSGHTTLYYPGAMAGRYFKPVDKTLFSQSSCALITVASREDNEYFFKQCQKHKLPLIFGVKMDLDAFPKSFLYKLLCYSRIIFTNKDENNQINSLFGFKNIKDLFQPDREQIIVTTQGKNGSTYYHNTPEGIDEQRIETCPTDKKIADYTGAGDSYVAGFLHSYFNSKSIKECCQMGSVCASFIIEKMGCTTNAPSKQKLYSRYTQWKGKSL